MTLEHFISRVLECYLTNLKTYPEENPTLNGAFIEILDLVILENKGE